MAFKDHVEVGSEWKLAPTAGSPGEQCVCEHKAHDGATLWSTKRLGRKFWLDAGGFYLPRRRMPRLRRQSTVARSDYVPRGFKATAKAKAAWKKAFE